MMIDVALLTKGGIVFCEIPKKTLDRFRELTMEARDNEVVWAELETDKGIKYEVSCEDVLVIYGGSFNA